VLNPFFFFFVTEDIGVPQAILLINGYPELWILRYPAHRYHAVPSPGFEPTTQLRVQHPNHLATTLTLSFQTLDPALKNAVLALSDHTSKSANY
jgi:hypothetical protein